MSKLIRLGGNSFNLFSIVDDEDYEYLSKFSWCNSHGYAVTRDKNNPKTHIRMHRLVLGIKSDYKVDHINHNTLDNRKKNLRIVSDVHSVTNRRPYSSKSKYKGVRGRNGGSYEALITYNKKQIYLGTFADEISAARAYNKKAKQLYGEYAFINNVCEEDMIK